MLELDPFFQRIQDYTGTIHLVNDPSAEVTVDQQGTFFNRCQELGSQPDLDTTAIDMRAAGEVEFTDEEILYLTGLRSDDNYYIFGASVWLNSKEHLDSPDKTTEITVLRRKPSEIGSLVMYLTRSEYEVTKTNPSDMYPNYYESRRIMDKRKLAKLREVAQKYMKDAGLVQLPSLPDKIEEPSPLIEIMRFTQARWVEAMLLLDMIADLQYLGIVSTEDLAST